MSLLLLRIIAVTFSTLSVILSYGGPIAGIWIGFKKGDGFFGAILIFFGIAAVSWIASVLTLAIAAPAIDKIYDRTGKDF